LEEVIDGCADLARRILPSVRVAGHNQTTIGTRLSTFLRQDGRAWAFPDLTSEVNAGAMAWLLSRLSCQQERICDGKEIGVGRHGQDF